MSWPIDTPEVIAERIGGALETAFPGTDARSENTFLGVNAAVLGMELFDVLLHQQRLVQEAFPDRATEEFVIRHADIRSLPRVAATRASGAATTAGTNGTPIPSGTSLQYEGAFFTTTAPAVIVSGGVTLAVRADAAGAAGNLPAGTVLTFVSPIAGLLSQTATVEVLGLSGGAPEEEVEALRARLLARIRQPPMGGAEHDYEAWARSASAEVGDVRMRPLWLGAGTVGVIVAMRGPRAPTGPELALVEAAIQAERPVTADVYVLGATLLPVDHVLTLTPDTAATRAAALAALAAFYVAEARIGTPVPLSRIREAISSAVGEYSHDLAAPAADVVPSATQIPVLGTVDFP